MFTCRSCPASRTPNNTLSSHVITNCVISAMPWTLPTTVNTKPSIAAFCLSIFFTKNILNKLNVVLKKAQKSYISASAFSPIFHLTCTTSCAQPSIITVKTCSRLYVTKVVFTVCRTWTSTRRTINSMPFTAYIV